MEEMDKADVLGSLSDDEGGHEDEEDVSEGDHRDNDDDASNCNGYGEAVIVGENGRIGEEDGPEQLRSPAEVLAFISSPSQEKLLQLGDMRTQLQHQVTLSDPHKAAEVLLKIASLYTEEPATKTAVFEAVDAVLAKVISASCFHSYCFLSALLVTMGLLKGEEKSNKVSLVPGQLLCLEHAVQQEYFAPHQARLLQVFVSRNTAALEQCGGALERLTSALEKKRDEDP